MGSSSRDNIRRVLAATDIVGLISARVPLKKAGSIYKACCPFHEEKTPSFTVSQSRQTYRCFGCGVHGDAINFLREFEHLSFREALYHLASRAGIELDADPDAGRNAMKARKYRSDIAREDALYHECWVLYLSEAGTIPLTQEDHNRLITAKRRIRNGLPMIYPVDGSPEHHEFDLIEGLEILIEGLGNRNSARSLRGQDIRHLLNDPIPTEVSEREIAAARAIYGILETGLELQSA